MGCTATSGAVHTNLSKTSKVLLTKNGPKNDKCEHSLKSNVTSQYTSCCLRLSVRTSPGYKTCFTATVNSMLRPQKYGCEQNHVTTI